MNLHHSLPAILLSFLLMASGAIADNHRNVTVAMVGDITPGTTYPSNRLPANDGHDLLTNVKGILQGATLSVCNFEGVFFVGGKSTNEGNPTGYSFRVPPSYVNLFPEAGIDFMCLANNHLRDFGPDGYKYTMHLLDSVGMPYAGLKGYKSYSIIVRDGIRFGVCAFGQNEYCYQHQDTATVLKILQELRPLCDVLIVSVHGGAEGSKASHLPYSTEYYVGEDRGKMRYFAHFCIDHGADLIHGHGPHVPRAVELYKNRFIAYSLGNFCNPFGFNLSGKCGYAPIIVVTLDPHGAFVNARIVSFKQRYGAGPIKDETGSSITEIKSLTQSDIRDSKLMVQDDGLIIRK